MSALIKLMVGLGNPGKEYNTTRHNAGFQFLDQWVENPSLEFRNARFGGQLGRSRGEGWDTWLFKPMRYMNRSGLPIAEILAYYKIQPNEVVVVHDELDLPPGTIRLKQGGGHGGHNGLRDTMNHIGKEFWRLRIGIGHPGRREQVVSYVLESPSKADISVIRAAIEDALVVFPTLLRGESQMAMNHLHSKR